MTGAAARIYKDAAGEWRWALRAANGITIADSGEGYVERNDCLEAWARVVEAAQSAVIELVETG